MRLLRWEKADMGTFRQISLNVVLSMFYRNLSRIHKNIFPTNLYSIAIHPHRGILPDLTGGHVVLPPVPWAGHYLAVHDALAQRPPSVQASIIDGVELATHVGQRYGFALDLKLPDRSRRDFIRLCCSRKRHLVFTLLRYGSLLLSLQLDRALAPLQFLFLYPLYLINFINLVCLLFRFRRLRHHHSLFELFHHLRLQAHFRGPLRQRHLVNLVLQLQQRKKQPFGPRWASYDVHIYRYDAIHALQHRIRIERPAYARSC